MRSPAAEMTTPLSPANGPSFMETTVPWVIVCSSPHPAYGRGQRLKIVRWCCPGLPFSQQVLCLAAQCETRILCENELRAETLFCLHCGKRITELGHPPDRFCSSAHRIEYSQRVHRLSELSKRVSGFKPTIVEIDPDAGQPVLLWKSERKLHLPGAWSLSSLKRRGIPLHASFSEAQRGPAPTASPRPVLSPATIVSARSARPALELSGKSSWDFRPRSTLQKSGSSSPLVVPPSVRPVTAWELPVSCKRENNWRSSDFLPLTLGVLPESPTFNLRSEEVVGPDYCSPLSGPICVTSWVRRSQLALPVHRTSRIQGLHTSDHLSLSPEPAPWSTKFEMVTRIPESGLTVAGLTIVDSCRPISSRSSSAGVDMAGPLSAVLNPGPTRLPCSITPSLIRPNLQRSDPNSPSLLEVSSSPHLFATTHQSCVAAIPEAETVTDGKVSRLWFAVRVPSPYMLETPTPLDTSKRLHYVHADRHFRFTTIPAEIVPHLAGLPAASGQALRAAPNPSSHSAAFRNLSCRCPA